MKERGLARFLLAWSRVKRYRALPVAGGIMAQANVFLAAADVVASAEAIADARDRRRAGEG